MDEEYCKLENEEMRLQWENGKTWIVEIAKWLEQKYGGKKKDEFLAGKGVKFTG